MTSSSLRRESRPSEDTLAIPSVPFRCTANDTWRGDVDPQRRLPERALESVDGSMRTSIERSGVSISFEMVGSGESVTLTRPEPLVQIIRATPRAQLRKPGPGSV
jgi:hypothetical protein